MGKMTHGRVLGSLANEWKVGALSAEMLDLAS